MWRRFRIAVLLLILATVAQQAWLAKADLDWKHSLYVAVYPVNADGSASVSDYLRGLQRKDFEALAAYFTQAAAPYHLGLRRPLELQLGAPVNAMPPAPPADKNLLSTIIWSLKFRLFAWNHSPAVNVKPDIRLYLLYYDPAKQPQLSHSTALSKGRLGRVNLYGARAYAEQNLVILAHELLHTLNATDKYDLSSSLPIYPEGFAEADKTPRYPQDFAELMAGRIPINATTARIPASLEQTLIGTITATEIGWLKSTEAD
jgi:hypothetical protein